MGFDVISAPEALNGGFGHAQAFGHGPDRPSCAIDWRSSGLGQDLLANVRVDPQFASGTFAFGQACKAPFHKAPLPVNDHGPAQTDLSGRLGLAESVSSIENDPSTLVFSLGRG